MELQDILNKAEEQREEYKRIKESTPYAKTLLKMYNIKNKMSKLQEQLDKLEKKAEKQSEKHYALLDKTPDGYYKDTIELVAQELMKRNPQFKSYYVIGCFGLSDSCSIWFFEDKLGYKDSDTTRVKASLTFHSSNCKSGMSVWTGEQTNKYPVGSIGDLNEWNFVMEEVVSIDQLNELLQKEYATRK